MKYIIISIVALFLSISSYSQEPKYQALFIYKFLQNIEWPAGKVTDKYTVAVVGDSEVLNQIKSLMKGRNINGKSVEAIEYSGSMEGVNLMFLSNSSKDRFDNVYQNTVSNSVVLVTESSGYAKKGACINFTNEGGKLKFEMNIESLQAAGLNASVSIKSLAVLVN